MQGVPVNFTHQHDRADFLALPGQPATELYRAHIQHHIFDPHSHEGFGLGVIECGAERFRYRGSQLLAGPGSLVLMNPDELHTGEAAHPLGRAIDYMQAYFARSITLTELAGAVNLSPYHFQRSFKARFHVTPQQMLMAIRLQRAKGWLAAGLPAAEVAAACGLADQSHLNRAFLRRYGTTPVRYQKQVQAGR